ncbi:MAG: hypothetical protein OXU23_03505 [Candidatus Poribacteria bacterium]|nr:hypothetical protein [Candidatus Poribacteria bacterium]
MNEADKCKIDWARLISKDWNKYYNLYIQSDEWKKKRKEVLKRDGYLCICGSKATMVHHKRYHHIGNEPLSDLVALCEYCHADLHERRKEERGW